MVNEGDKDNDDAVNLPELPYNDRHAKGEESLKEFHIERRIDTDSTYMMNNDEINDEGETHDNDSEDESSNLCWLA